MVINKPRHLAEHFACNQARRIAGHIHVAMRAPGEHESADEAKIALMEILGKKAQHMTIARKGDPQKAADMCRHVWRAPEIMNFHNSPPSNICMSKPKSCNRSVREAPPACAWIEPFIRIEAQ